MLRRTGLGYTIVRPGPLLEEPGGYKALVFDQGNRITQSISIADVADVSLKVCVGPVKVVQATTLCPEPCAFSVHVRLIARLGATFRRSHGLSRAVCQTRYQRNSQTFNRRRKFY